MFDFLARKTRALRRSGRWFLMVVAAQAATAIATGVVIGYLLMLLIALAMSMESVDGKGERGYHDRGRHRYTISTEKFLEIISAPETDQPRLINPPRLLWYCSLAGIGSVAMIILVATAIERRRINQRGGWALGLALGGRWLDEPTSASDRKVLNIVEELAIAFHSPVPAVLVLDGEPGINVFAAGLDPQNSILCVTAGAIDVLSREELQGVVAHEFSHLTNRDTAFGTRLTSILYGLNGIHVVAAKCFVYGHQCADSEDESGPLGWLMMLAGAMVWPFGLMGACSATLLSLAFSRCRERLADAEAVEKTRNPEALARALRRIAGHRQGGRLRHPASSIVAPMLFVDRNGSGGTFSTHPPMIKRLAAIDPAGDHSAIYPEAKSVKLSDESPKTAAVINAIFGGDGLAGPGETPAATTSGRVESEGMDQLRAAVPEPILELVQFPASLPLAATMLLGVDDPDVPMASARDKLLSAFEALDGPLRFAMLAALCDQAVHLSAADKQPLTELLGRMETSLEPNDWYRHGWVWLLRDALGVDQAEVVGASLGNQQIAASAVIVLSVVCLCDGETGMSDYEFLRGWIPLGLGEARRVPAEELSWEQFLVALQTLTDAPPQTRQLILVSIANTVSGDAAISPEESVIVQVIRKFLHGEIAWLAPTEV